MSRPLPLNHNNKGPAQPPPPPVSPHQPGSPPGHTIRRLSDDDVRAIFECLHHCTPLPERLEFTIVPVGPNGLKLSPPSYEFEDGLYVLLRPPKKPKSGQSVPPENMPRAPSHLQHFVVGLDHWNETCPWSLSGPQFPQPTAIQQRYCYPKGAPEYSSRVGGALWTMYGADGKEDLTFRLLHVYYSAKRAVNKGLALPPPPTPKTPTKKSKMRTPSPQRRSRIWQQQQQQHQPMTPSHYHQPYPFMTTTSASGICHSPLSVDWASPLSLPQGASASPLLPHLRDNKISKRTRNNDDSTVDHHHRGHHHGHHHDNSNSNWVMTPVSDLFRRRPGTSRASPAAMTTTPTTTTTASSNSSNTLPSPKRSRTEDSADGSGMLMMSASKSLDALDMESSLQELDSFYWNDPLLTILMQPSHESFKSTGSTGMGANHHPGGGSAPLTMPMAALPQRLGRLQEKLRDMATENAETAALIREFAENLALECKDKVPI